MSLSDSYSCRLSIYSSLEKLFSPNPTIPYPSHVYIHGNNNTGKSTIIKHVLNQYKHTILWFDCRYFHHTLILIGHQPFYQLPHMNQIEVELGVLTPTTIFIPAYTRTE
ncbi:unnamed protein product, partial [Rotaria sp. Silwood1]